MNIHFFLKIFLGKNQNHDLRIDEIKYEVKHEIIMGYIYIWSCEADKGFGVVACYC